MSKNNEILLQMLKEQVPEMHIFFVSMQKGHISPAEVAEVIYRMSIVRSSDDGHGKIVIEMQRKKEGNWMRIRTIQDKILPLIEEERLI